jgi:hypothetical protein
MGWFHVAAASTRMLQHRFNDTIGTGTVFVDFAEIGFDVVQDFEDVTNSRNIPRLRPDSSRDYGTPFEGGLFYPSPVTRLLSQFFPRFLHQFQTNLRKIIYKIQRIFDFVGNTGGELAQGSEFFLLYELFLGGFQIFMSIFKILMCCLQVPIR